MTDLQCAKEGLRGNTVCLVKGDNVFTSDRRGIAPLIAFIDGGGSFKDFSAADKIVGKAAALLYVYMGVEEVYAEVMSKAAEEVFISYGVRYGCGVLVEKIINRKGDGMCPMEQTVKDISSPEEALPALKDKLEALKKSS